MNMRFISVHVYFHANKTRFHKRTRFKLGASGTRTIRKVVGDGGGENTKTDFCKGKMTRKKYRMLKK